MFQSVGLVQTNKQLIMCGLAFNIVCKEGAWLGWGPDAYLRIQQSTYQFNTQPSVSTFFTPS